MVILLSIFLESRIYCNQKQIKAGVEGEITGSLEAGRSSNSNCTLELTNVPQYTLVKFTVNYYKQPENCSCDQVDSPKCSQIFAVETPGSKKSFCDKPSDLFYLYKNSTDNIVVVFSGINLNDDSSINITYRGE